MMTGYVRFGHAFLELSFLGGNDGIVPVEFVIDTGFTSYLTLPLADVTALGLALSDVIEADLADGSKISVSVYDAVIFWHGEELELEVIAMGERPLLGLASLRDNDVNIEFVENGAVTIAPRLPITP